MYACDTLNLDRTSPDAYSNAASSRAPCLLVELYQLQLAVCRHVTVELQADCLPAIWQALKPQYP
jgi:hypothetical protein